MAESILHGAVYGTAIGKVVVKEKSFKFPTENGIEESKEIRVVFEPVDPNNFVIDPAATTIDEALGCAQIIIKPIHGIKAKQESGVYYKGELGACNDDMVSQLDGLQRPQNTEGMCKIVEWHGLVPKVLLKKKTGSVADLPDSPEMVEAIVTIANETFRLKAVENPFLMKDRSFIAYQHDKIPNSFFGRGIAEKGWHPHKALEAEMRGRIDAMAFSIHPMVAMDASKVPRGEKFTIFPGKTILTNGNPAEAIQPLKFNPPDLASFKATNDYERMTQMATGSMDSAAGGAISSRNNTASGMSMILQGAIKRSKRTMRNAEQNFLDEWVRKSAWRYMQFAPERYPSMDLKFKVHSTMGYENSTLTTKEEMLELLEQQLQSSLQPQPDPKAEFDAKKLELEALRSEADANKKNAEGQLATAKIDLVDADILKITEDLERKEFDSVSQATHNTTVHNHSKAS